MAKLASLYWIATLPLRVSDGHEQRRFFVFSSSDWDISCVFEIRYAAYDIKQQLNFRTTYRILNIQFSVNQLPSYMVYDVIDIFRCLAVKSFENRYDTVSNVPFLTSATYWSTETLAGPWTFGP